MRRDPKHLLFELSPSERSYRGIWLLALLYFGSLLSGAILSLIAFRLTHYLDPDASSYLAGKSYPKFFDRARWVSVLLLLPYLFVSCRLTRFRSIGFARPFASSFGLWFFSGIAMILLIYGSNALFGAFSLDPNWNSSQLLRALDDALLAALIIGCLEEIVFRGLVFRMFYTAFNPLPALLLSSLFFAVLHFKSPELALGGIPPSEVGLQEAFRIAWETAIAPVVSFDFKYLLAIFLVGVTLHQVFLLTGNLWASVGLHAGWVFTIKSCGEAFQTTPAANAFTGSTRVADGYWVSVVLLLFIAFFAYLIHRKETARKHAA